MIDSPNSRLEPLSQAIQQVFEARTADLDPADVLGLGLFSDGDGMSIVAAVYTRAGHEANLARYSGPEYQGDAYASFDWELYLRWYPGELDRNTTLHHTPAAEPLERMWAEMRDRRETPP